MPKLTFFTKKEGVAQPLSEQGNLIAEAGRRWKLLVKLQKGEISQSQLAMALAKKQPEIHKNVTKLEGCHLVTTRKKGKGKFVSLSNLGRHMVDASVYRCLPCK